MAGAPGVLRGPATVLLVGAAVVAACDRPAPTETGGPFSRAIAASHRGRSPFPGVGEFGCHVALDWFRLAYVLTQQERLAPLVASRAFGYVGDARGEAGDVRYMDAEGR